MLQALSNTRYPRIAFHRMRMKTTKEQIRRRRRQKNLSWKLANEAKRRTWWSEEKDGRDREREASEEENEDAKWRTGESSRGPYHGYTTDLWHSRSLFHGFAEGEEDGFRLVLGTEGKVNPIASRKRGDLPIDDELLCCRIARIWYSRTTQDMIYHERNFINRRGASYFIYL